MASMTTMNITTNTIIKQLERAHKSEQVSAHEMAGFIL